MNASGGTGGSRTWAREHRGDPRIRWLAALVAGLALAASLPPVGFWPLAPVGVVALDAALAGAGRRSRFLRGWLTGLALLGATMWWMTGLTVPGYGIAVIVYGAIVGAMMATCPPHGLARWVALPGAWVLAEGIRTAWPFGGVPLSTLAMGQVAGPLAGVARLGGVLAVGLVTVGFGVALAAALQRRWVVTVGAAGSVLIIVAVAAVAPRGADTGETVSVALVQGGGPQGTRAIDTDPDEVVARHLEATETVTPGLDLTLWPEDVVDTGPTIADTEVGEELASSARRLDTTLIVGVIADDGDDAFRNASVAWNPRGEIIDRYEKVQRVPFGEWVPFRPLIETVAPASLTERDAVRGIGPPTLATPSGKVAVVISWEVFFGHRAVAGVLDGGGAIINPTNGSTFTGTQVQAQQVASSRLRAIETGRWLAQIAPTGFSGRIDPDGRVLERTAISEQAVIEGTLEMRRGQTVYARIGDFPAVVVALLLLIAGWILDGGLWAGLRRLRSRRDRPRATGSPARR